MSKIKRTYKWISPLSRENISGVSDFVKLNLKGNVTEEIRSSYSSYLLKQIGAGNIILVKLTSGLYDFIKTGRDEPTRGLISDSDGLYYNQDRMCELYSKGFYDG